LLFINFITGDKSQEFNRYFFNPGNVKNSEMRDRIIMLFTIILAGSFIACFDRNSTEGKVDGPYFVASDSFSNLKVLYYHVENGSPIERVRNVKRVGHTDKFIIVEVQNGYYFIDRSKDNESLNGNEIIGDLKTH
jgi:hypothetical protein